MTAVSGRVDSAAALADRLLRHYPEVAARPRRVGREIEIPVVDDVGRAREVAHLWPALLELPGSRAVREEDGLVVGVQRPYGLVSVEFGRAVVEVALDPADDLHAQRRLADVALSELRAAADAAGVRLLGLGMQPRTRATAAQMTPKRRYVTLADAVGPGALRWTGTAADQIHVDVARDELVPALNVVNGLSGVLIALCANSPLYAGRPAGAVASREAHVIAALDEPHRWGSTPRRFSSVEDYVVYVLGFRPLEKAPDDHDSWERYVELDHVVWPSGRAAFRFGTVEVRPACQQPFRSFWVASAIGLGLIENAADAEAWMAERADWDELMAFRARAVRSGLRAPEPWPGFVREALELAHAGLARRGVGEERYLDDAWDRLERGRCPADDALATVAAEGFGGLVAARSL